MRVRAKWFATRSRLCRAPSGDAFEARGEQVEAMRNWYEYTLKVRPHRKRYGGQKSSSSRKPQVVRIVAKSKFDAELAFRNGNPGMTVVSAERGNRVDDPAGAGR